MELPSVSTYSSLYTFEGKAGKAKSLLYFLLLTCVLVLPLSVEISTTKNARLNFPLEVLLPCAALLTAVIGVYNRAFIFSFADLAVLLFIGAAGISAVFSRIPVFSWKAFAVLCTYSTALYFGFRLLRLSRIQWNLVWRVAAFSFMLLMLYTIVRYFHLGIHRQHSYAMSLPFVSGHTLLIAVGFPAFLFSLDELLRKQNFRFNIPFVLLFIFTTAISFSRIYWVIVFVFSLTMIFYYFKKVRWPAVIFLAAFILAGSIAYQKILEKRDREAAWLDPDDHNSLFVQLQSIFIWGKNESNIERGNRWRVALEIFKRHPVTGSGLNTYLEVYFWYKDRAVLEETNLSCNRMNAHQLYAGWLSDMGIIGFAAGMLMLLSFAASVVAVRGAPHFLLTLLLLLNFLLLGLIEDFTTLEKIMSVFWISMAFIVSQKIETTRHQKSVQNEK